MVRTVQLGEEQHAVTLLNGFKELKNEESLCDFTVHVETIEFRVHKTVLAIRSPYFKAMLKHDTKESQEGRVEMKSVDAECVKNCVDFMYSGKFDIPDGKIDKLLHVAIMMQLDDVKEAICNILEEELTAENFHQTRSIAALYQLPTVLQKCKMYYGDNFMMISAQLGFQSEAKSHLVNVLKSKKLKLSEEDKLVVSLRWIGNDPDKRGELLDLIKLIKLEEVSISYLSDLLESHPVISNDLALYKLINEPLVGYVKKNSNELKNNDCQGDKILVLFDQDANCLQSYQPTTNEVAKFHDKKFKHLKNFTALSMESYIYILRDSQSVHRLNFKDKNSKWERMENMIADHGDCPPSVAYFGSIFIIGCCSALPTNDVEKFDTAEKKWLRLNDKPEAVCLHTLVTLNDSIFCVGGSNESKSLKALCKFTPSTSEWVDLEPMKKARYQCGAVAVEQKIFVMGGWCDPGNINEVECYDVTIGQWTSLSPLIEPDWFIVAHHINGVIFSVPHGDINKTKKYDISKDEWTKIDFKGVSNFNIYDCVCVRKEVNE